MGSNDHDPKGSATLKPWVTREPKAVITWSNVNPQLIIEMISQAGKNGAYLGFGSSSDSTALLLYVKSGNISERIAIESIAESKTIIEWILLHYLNSR